MKIKKVQPVRRKVIQISLLVGNNEVFRTLTASKSFNPRKEMFAMLNDILGTSISYGAWKQRFIYPETKVPKLYREFIVPAMERVLIWAIAENKQYGQLLITDWTLHIRRLTEFQELYLSTETKIIQVPDEVFN